MRTPFVEPLESRTLFAGVTIITHGRDGHLWGFVDTAAAAITKRLGGPSQAPQYTITVTPDPGDGHLVPTITHKDGTATPQTSTSGEIIVLLDWTSIDKITDYHLDYIAGVFTDVFMNQLVGGVRLAELPIRELSLSRGTGLCDEIAKSLGKAGIWVEQETYCDPNPVEVMGDASPVIYDNVAFVDNYWRADANPNNQSTNGMPVNGAYNLRVQWLDSHINGWAMAHIVPAGWYVGTIDTTATNGGEGPIYSDWYGNTPDKPARDQTGFIYTSIVGATRPSAGVWEASGGSGTRTAAGQDGAQWANATDLAIVGNGTFNNHTSIKVQYIHQDRDGNNDVTFYLDADKNPYNGNFAHTFGSVGFAGSSSIDTTQTNLVTDGSPTGTYYIVAKSTDGQGHVRFTYSKQVSVTQAAPFSARLASDSTLRIGGTSGNDIIRVYRSLDLPDRLVVQINASSASYLVSSIERIFISGLDGNDSILINEANGAITTPVRITGGNGNDTLAGGSGRDTILGEGGNDRVYGGAGNDNLVGGDGTDRLYGQTGKDVFVGAKAKELIDFLRGDRLLK